MKNQKWEFGRESEKRALQWFLDQGNYQLLELNYRWRRGEIDLILEQTHLGLSKNETEIVFVEIKARDHRTKICGLESIDFKKRRRVQATAEHFLMRYHGKSRSARFDVLYWKGNEWEYIPSAWSFD